MKPICDPKHVDLQLNAGTDKAAIKESRSGHDPVRKAMRRRWLNGMKRVLSSPATNVLVLATAIIATFVGSRILARPESAVQLKFYEQGGQVDAGAESGQRQAPASNIFGGEVYDTAIRLQETAALGMAISLTVVKEAAETKRIPPSIDQIVSTASSRGLLPPGITLDSGRVTSPSSTFLIRYQVNPFQFEIVSCPIATTQGPALMFRFPLKAVGPKSLAYYRSSIARRESLPPAFASPEQLSEIGWTSETWRVELRGSDAQSRTELEEERNAWSELQ